jgi:hypothetical protein
MPTDYPFTEADKQYQLPTRKLRLAHLQGVPDNHAEHIGETH